MIVELSPRGIRILNFVADYFNIEQGLLFGTSLDDRIVVARTSAIFLLKKLCNLEVNSIKRIFRIAHYTTDFDRTDAGEILIKAFIETYIEK